MLKAVVCDDETPALDLMAEMLEATGKIDVVAACQSVNEALAIINRGGIDLVVLDVEMPERTGVEAAGAITVEPKPLLIFATAHAEYAVDAFGIDAIDYILKPVEQSRVRQAVDKAERLQRLISTATQGDTVAASEPEGLERDRDLLQLRDGGRFYVVPMNDIVWVEAGGDYSLIHTATSEIVIRRTLSSLEHALPGDRFLRVHRSGIVGLVHIREVRRLPKGEAEIRLTGDVTVRSSRSYRDAISSLIAD